MKPGELVKICDERGCQSDAQILIGNMSTTDERWYVDAGSLALFISGHRVDRSNDPPAFVIFLNGRLGWVWADEILPLGDEIEAAS